MDEATKKLNDFIWNTFKRSIMERESEIEYFLISGAMLRDICIIESVTGNQKWRLT